METFKICACNTCDLPDSYLKANDLGIVSLSYQFGEEIYERGECALAGSVFYKRMREGQMPTTLPVTYAYAADFFMGILETCPNILLLCFSSSLSESYLNLRLAAQDIVKRKKGVRILVIDSLCASLGEGLLVHKAVELKKQGKSMEETAIWIESHKRNMVHAFAVDNIYHLYRGGRVSKASAVVKTIVNARPLFHVDGEGRLAALGNAHGRQKSLNSLVNYMETHMGSFRDQNDTVFISHGDSREDAEYVAQEVRKRFGICNVLINYICPIIGAHSGPGTIALFFLGDKR